MLCHVGRVLLVGGFLKFLFDAIEAYAYILYRDADDGGNFLVRKTFEPQQNNGAVKWLKTMDAAVEHLDLLGVVVHVAK